jgi:truncated hemoglobin YjbI
MNSVWPVALSLVALMCALGSAVFAIIIYIRQRDQAQDHDSLVDALNRAGAGIVYGPGGYVRETPHPLAEPLPEPAPSAATLRAVQRSAHALRDPQVTQPPTPGVDEWIKYWSPDPDVTWSGVIKQFYEAASDDPEIAAYFARVDMERLQKHFVHMMTIITRDGVTSSMLRAMKHAHHGILDKDGNPMVITGPVYDRTVGTLGVVLRKNGVPADAIGALVKTIAPLRDAIVG